MGGGICQKVMLLHNPFSKMGDKWEGGVKNSQKIGDVIYGWPQSETIHG